MDSTPFNKEFLIFKIKIEFKILKNNPFIIA